MRFLAVLMLLLPLAAHAAEGARWRNCNEDAQCVLIEGICSKIAVHQDFKTDAEVYFTQERRRANCAEKFWQPKQFVADCHLNSCRAAATSK